MPNIKVLFWLDVEDYINPESQEGLLGILQLLEDRKVPGIFKIVGEKARQLRLNNRSDILSLLPNHEVGYHTDLHSQHPVISEYLEHYDFRTGAEEFDTREKGGFEDVRSITGMPVMCYGQPGYSWAPQAFPALKQWGIPVYLDDHDHISWEGKPFWYGGMLNITNVTGTMRMELNEGGLEKAKVTFDQLYEQLSTEQTGFVSIYYHPNEFVCSSFWDKINYMRGMQTPREEWKPAPLREKGEMEHYLSLLGQFIDYTLSKEHVEYITSEQALLLESSRTDVVDVEDVKLLAEELGSKLGFKIIDGHSLSAADQYSLFRGMLLGEQLIPEFMYGPAHHIESDRPDSLVVNDILKSLSTIDMPSVLGFKMLPDYFMLGDYRINPVDMTCTMASIIAQGLQGEDRIELVRGELQARSYAGDNELWGPRWSIFEKELRVPNIVSMSKLQTWTLKPAMFELRH